MIEWISNNAEVVSSLGTVATLLVWIVWLQLMYSDYRSRRQPRMLIHRTHRPGPDSNCLLVNLSQEIIHVVCVQALARSDGDDKLIVLGSESANIQSLDTGEFENILSQGPLRPGEFLRLGSFEQMLEELTQQAPADESEQLSPEAVKGVNMMEIRVVGVFGNSDKSIGALRRFEIESEDGSLRVEPKDVYTKQLYSRRRRRVTEEWLRDCRP